MSNLKNVSVLGSSIGAHSSLALSGPNDGDDSGSGDGGGGNGEGEEEPVIYKKYHVIEFEEIIKSSDTKIKDSIPLWNVTNLIAGEFAEQAEQVINQGFGNANTSLIEAGDVAYDKTTVTSRVESCPAVSLVDQMWSAARNQVQGQEGEWHFNKVLNNTSVLYEGVGRDETPNTDTFEVTVDPFAYLLMPKQVPFLVFQSVKETGKTDKICEGPKLREPYPCRIAPNGDVLVETPNERGIMPEVANGGASGCGRKGERRIASVTGYYDG
jgi:hypothetical protein